MNVNNPGVRPGVESVNRANELETLQRIDQDEQILGNSDSADVNEVPKARIQILPEDFFKNSKSLDQILAGVRKNFSKVGGTGKVNKDEGTNETSGTDSDENYSINLLPEDFIEGNVPMNKLLENPSLLESMAVGGETPEMDDPAWDRETLGKFSKLLKGGEHAQKMVENLPPEARNALRKAMKGDQKDLMALASKDPDKAIFPGLKGFENITGGDLLRLQNQLPQGLKSLAGRVNQFQIPQFKTPQQGSGNNGQLNLTMGETKYAQEPTMRPIALPKADVGTFQAISQGLQSVHGIKKDLVEGKSLTLESLDVAGYLSPEGYGATVGRIAGYAMSGLLSGGPVASVLLAAGGGLLGEKTTGNSRKAGRQFAQDFERKNQDAFEFSGLAGNASIWGDVWGL